MCDSNEQTGYTGSLMTVDPGGQGKDKTSYAVVKYLHGRHFLLDCGGFRGGYVESVFEALVGIAMAYAVNARVAELNIGEGILNELMKKLRPG